MKDDAYILKGLKEIAVKIKMLLEKISSTFAQKMKIFGSQLSTTGINKLPTAPPPPPPPIQKENTLLKIFLILPSKTVLMLSTKFQKYLEINIWQYRTPLCNIPSLLKTFMLLFFLTQNYIASEDLCWD